MCEINFRTIDYTLYYMQITVERIFLLSYHCLPIHRHIPIPYFQLYYPDVWRPSSCCRSWWRCPCPGEDSDAQCGVVLETGWKWNPLYCPQRLEEDEERMARQFPCDINKAKWLEMSKWGWTLLLHHAWADSGCARESETEPRSEAVVWSLPPRHLFDSTSVSKQKQSTERDGVIRKVQQWLVAEMQPLLTPTTILLEFSLKLPQTEQKI